MHPASESHKVCGLTVSAYRLKHSPSGLWAENLLHTACEYSHSSWSQVHVRSPWVPFHLLLVAEAEEARADAHGYPGADFVEEPLEGEETGHRDGKDKLAEWVHGHPTSLWTEQKNSLVSTVRPCAENGRLGVQRWRWHCQILKYNSVERTWNLRETINRIRQHWVDGQGGFGPSGKTELTGEVWQEKQVRLGWLGLTGWVEQHAGSGNKVNSHGPFCWVLSNETFWEGAGSVDPLLLLHQDTFS